MNCVEVRGVKIGEGIPKICVPIVEETAEGILQAAEALKDSTFDIVEWRADWFQDYMEMDKNIEVLQGLREILKEKPLLYTFRTAGEGGQKEIEPEVYEELLTEIAQTGLVDLIDVEGYMGDEVPETTEIFEGNMMPVYLIRKLHKAGVSVIASNHDFDGTPDKDDIINRLQFMQDLGADIIKIAVMPHSAEDVLKLLSATEEMKRLHAKCPLVTMSMSGNGLISRLCGEVFGSALTFGAVGRTSAPGQLEAEELNRVLQILHENLAEKAE